MPSKRGTIPIPLYSRELSQWIIPGKWKKESLLRNKLSSQEYFMCKKSLTKGIDNIKHKGECIVKKGKEYTVNM